jgi:hypothetical protein
MTRVRSGAELLRRIIKGNRARLADARAMGATDAELRTWEEEVRQLEQRLQEEVTKCSTATH